MPIAANIFTILGGLSAALLITLTFSSQACRALARFLRAQAAGIEAMRKARAEDLGKEL